MKRHLSPSILLLVVAICTGTGENAAAEPTSDAAESFARGKKLFAKRDYTGAIAAFERAYSLRPHHAVQCSIAHCYQQMNRFVESAEHFRRCLKEGASKTKTAKQVERSLAEVEARISWIEVQSPGPGGTVHVNGVLKGPAPRRVPLNPGRHLIEVRRPGAKTATLSVKVLSGEERSVSLVPIVEARPEPASKTTPEVTVEKTAEKRPAPRRGLSSTWFWTTAALTVALAAAAGTMGGLTYKAHEDYYDSPTKEGYDTFTTRRLITNILAGCAVAAGGTSTVLFFYTDFGGGAKEAKTAVVLGLSGTF